MYLLTRSRIFKKIKRNNTQNTGNDIAALLRQLDGRVKREDLIHVSFENDGKKKPWFVAIDRARRRIVLSVRGSLSAVDVVTDLCFADPTQNKVASESLELYVCSSHPCVKQNSHSKTHTQIRKGVRSPRNGCKERYCTLRYSV